jgi:uncharacterized membrane protein YjfL (UPF0719 family)
MGFIFLGWVVGYWADQQIRDNSGYVLLVFAMGGACLTIAVAVLPWFGISLRDDAFEQRNFSAVLALSGAIAGVLITYSFANVGDGPSFWNNVFSSFLATGSLLLVLLFASAVGGATVSIVEERDNAAGMRIGGLLIAAALIFGRAVAGDWESTEATMQDFIRDGWPAFVLCIAAIFTERMLRPTLHNPKPSVTTHGWMPAASYLLVAIFWLVHLGWWEGVAR